MFKYQTILILLFVLGAATCFIAYMSDQLGMKLGKKRISLMGLRPRQTATALSMASSLAVMIVTMLVLLAINPPLRQGLLYYDEARRENVRLSGLNAGLKTQSEKQSNAIKKQTQANQQLEKSLRGKNLQLVGLNHRVSQTQQQVNAAQQQLNAAQRNLQSAQSEREAAQHARDAAQSARDAAQAAQNRAQAGQQQARQGEAQAKAGFQAAQSRFQAAQASFVLAQQQEKIARQGVEKARAELHNANAQLSSTRLQLQTAQLKVKNAVKATVDSFKLVAEASQQQAKLNARNAQLDARISQQTELIAAYDQRLNQAGRLLSGADKVAVATGQVFSATIIPANSSESACLTTLQTLMENANEVARKSGYQTLHLEPIQVNQGEQATVLSEDQNLTLTAAFLTNQPTPVSVRVVAARDHSEYSADEPEIIARVQAVIVRPAFASGEVIAETTINGGQSGPQGDAQVFNRLLNLLDEGQKIVKSRGILPIPTEAEPNVYASDTRLSIFQALRQIQQKGGDVPVRLVAATALSTIEPVRIRIEVGDADATAVATPSSATPDATPNVTPDKVSDAPQKT